MKSDRLRLTPAGVKLLAGVVALALAGRLLGVVEAYAGAVALLSVLMFSVARSMLWHPMVSVSRDVSPEQVELDDPCFIELNIENRSRRASPPITVSDFVEGAGPATIAAAPIGPNGVGSVTFALPTSRRGRFSLGPCTSALLDPFRLVRRSVAGAGPSSFVVWPRTWPVSLPLDGATADTTRTRSDPRVTPSAGAEFATLGEYVPGDDLRHIHWPSSARAGRLMVRRFEPPAPHTTWVFIDTAASNTASFEVAVSIAASIVLSVVRSGGSAGLKPVRRSDPEPLSGEGGALVRTTSQLRSAFDDLAELGPDFGDDDSSSTAQGIASALRSTSFHSGDRIVLVTAAPDSAEWRAFTADALLRVAPENTNLMVIEVPAAATISSMGVDRIQRLLDESPAGSARSARFTHG